MPPSGLQGWWVEHRIRIVQFAVVVMILITPHRLVVGFSRLLLERPPAPAVDLKLRYNEVHTWFPGRFPQEKPGRGAYPPATYVILWPFLGWLTLTSAQWLWAVVTGVTLGWLAYFLVRESDAATLWERLFVGLLPFSMYATSVATGNGQLVIPVLSALVTGLVLLLDRQQGWQIDVFAGVLILLALVSPTIAAPFFWLVLFVPGTFRPAALISLGYGALTLLAISSQQRDPLSVLLRWHVRARDGVLGGAVRGGYANLHSWLAAVGLEDWNRSASLLVLAALGVWVYRHRRGDLWCLLGVTTLVSRVWAYHRVYDDFLIVIPAIALFRLARRSSPADRNGVAASVLLAATWIAVLSPPRLLYFSPPWNWLFQVEQMVVWGAVLLFLLSNVEMRPVASLRPVTSA
jgi:hypothetical protein